MEVTFNKVESSRVRVSGETATIKVEGSATIGENKKVTEATGSFFRISDNMNVGTYNMYGSTNVSYNMNDNSLACDCVEAFTLYIADIEKKASSSSLSLN